MKSDTRWLIANWKMNGTAASVREYAAALSSVLSAAPTTIECAFCPPSLYIAPAIESRTGRLKIGAQDCHGQAKGAFTGEVSAAMLKDTGCELVIVGHSERRAAGETDAQVYVKAQAAIAAGLIPVICVGESEAEYLAKTTNDVLSHQLVKLTELATNSYLIAYEPVWAIGTGKTPQLLEIEAVHAYIKSVLGSVTSVLYGGSVNSANAREILQIPEVSGALVGSASLTVPVMQDIINAA